MPGNDTVDEERAYLARRLVEFKYDPLGYVIWAFPWGKPGTELADMNGPRTWQVAVLKRIGELLRARRLDPQGAIQIARASGHGIGKSALLAMITMWALSTLVDTKVAITANTEKQLHTKTSPELAKWHRMALNASMFVFTATSLYASDPEHSRTWRADLIPWSEHNTESFAGLHNEGKRIVLLMDESSAIADKVWETSEGALTDSNTQIIWLALGNPTRNTGRFRECFRKYKHRWDHDQIDSRTVEGVNLQQVQKWVEDYGEDSDFVKVRVRGMFPSASAKQFISETDVDAAYGKKLHPHAVDHAPKILTVDPAWTGDDEFVVGLRQGLAFKVLRVIARNDNDVEMANMIARTEDEEGADAVFVDFGYGTGIVSVGRTLGRDWILVNFGAKSDDSACLNKRAEMWSAMRTWLKEGGAIPADPQMHAELISVETIARLDSKLQLEDKEHMRARGVPSPGRADSLALSFAHPVMKKDRGAGPTRRNQSLVEYNPLAELGV
jgi:hypothetical protein